MSWRLPPPIWLSSQARPKLLGRLLHAGVVGWRLTKWSTTAGAVIVAAEWLTRDADALWSAAAWLVGGALIILLWERYGLAESAIGTGRVNQGIATFLIALLGGSATWFTAHVLTALALSLS
jgi:hypothetical protein